MLGYISNNVSYVDRDPRCVGFEKQMIHVRLCLATVVGAQRYKSIGHANLFLRWSYTYG